MRDVYHVHNVFHLVESDSLQTINLFWPIFRKLLTALSAQTAWILFMHPRRFLKNRTMWIFWKGTYAVDYYLEIKSMPISKPFFSNAFSPLLVLELYTSKFALFAEILRYSETTWRCSWRIISLWSPFTLIPLCSILQSLPT